MKDHQDATGHAMYNYHPGKGGMAQVRASATCAKPAICFIRHESSASRQSHNWEGQQCYYDFLAEQGYP